MKTFNIRKIFFILLVTGCLSTLVRADQNDERLDELFEQLKKAENEIQAYPIEARIWSIWYEHENPQAAGLMQRGINEMEYGQLQAALATYTRLIALAPDYAEAWNKRATIYYLLRNYEASEADIVETLKLEPFHFGALSGRGMVCLGQGDYIKARSAFNAALEVNPTMSGARTSLQALEQILNRNSI